MPAGPCPTVGTDSTRAQGGSGFGEATTQMMQLMRGHRGLRSELAQP